MRLFFAVWPPPEILRALLELQSALKQSRADVRWSPRENLHFTLRFLGEVPPSGLAVLGRVAACVGAGVAPFEISLSGVGSFPERGEPRIVWAGVGSGRPALNGLASVLESALASEGFGQCDKPFRPHLTLGRVNSLLGVAALRDVMGQRAGTTIGPWTVRSFALVESVLGPGGARYTNLADFPIGTSRG